MEVKKDNTKIIIILLVSLIIILLTLVILFITNTISLNPNNSDNTTNNIKDNNINKDNHTEQLSDEEQKGLELYKTFTADGTGPFIWENGIVTNYDYILSKMTNSYIESFKTNAYDHGFTIPYKEDGIWKSIGGFGTDEVSKFKDIKITLIESCRIHYEISYSHAKLNNPTIELNDGISEFIVKTKPCDENDIDNDFSNGYKVDSFKLIFGLKFE